MPILLGQPKFTMLGLEVNGYPIELGMEIDKRIKQGCKLRTSFSGVKLREKIMSLMVKNEFLSRNCTISVFAGELKIIQCNNYFPYRQWMKTRVYFEFNNHRLSALTIRFWSDSGVAGGRLNGFETLCDKWLNPTYDRKRAARTMPDQVTLDEFIDKGGFRMPGEWESNGTIITSELLRCRQTATRPRRVSSITWFIDPQTPEPLTKPSSRSTSI